MNTKNLSITLITLFAVILTACAMKPTQVAVFPAPTQPPAYAAEKATAAPELPKPGTVPTPADNTFQDYGVNPMEDAGEDHLSTFALDVDTASYTVARSYVMDGNLPPADAIRVEEFVNYFDQGYPTPEGVAFAIYADGAPSPFHGDGTYILRFGVQGYRVPAYARKPASLTFVIDTSGSMARENRLEMVKGSLEYLVDRLDEDDTVAIVAYGSTARVVLEPTRVDDRNAILDAIYSLGTSGTTNADAGLRLGYRLAMEAFRSEATNRVILCSDGVANTGATSPDEILDRVHGYVEEGVTITAIGVGMGNFNDVLLEQLADKGNGNYFYVDTLDEARKVFAENLTSTLQVIALDAKVQVDFNPEVVDRYRLIGYENRAVSDQQFRDDRVDAGELGAGHSATALYAVQFHEGAEGRIATIQLRWEDPDTHEIHEINGNFNSWDLESDFESADLNYRLAVVVGQYAEILRQSPYARGTSLDKLSEYAADLAREFSEDSDVTEFAQLVERASRIRGR